MVTENLHGIRGRLKGISNVIVLLQNLYNRIKKLILMYITGTSILNSPYKYTVRCDWDVFNSTIHINLVAQNVYC